MHVSLILGAPGCGKTTRLISLVSDELSRGVQPEKIAFVSFTRQAAQVALARARDKFNISEKRFSLFRTLHSLTFRGLHMRYNDMMQPKHYEALFDKLGVEYSRGASIEDNTAPEEIKLGNRLVFLETLARNRCVSVDEVWRDNDMHCELPQLHQFTAAFKQYKHDNGLYDYTDLLELYVEKGNPFIVDAAFVDEAQDLSQLQWRVVRKAFKNTQRMYIAGDDDQAIYEWSGADVDTFLSLVTDSREVLSVSHRLTKNVKALADSIIGRVSQRYNKVFGCRDNDAGTIEWKTSTDVVLSDHAGSWMLLARNTKHLREYISICKMQGVVYKIKGESSVDPLHIHAIKIWTRLTKGGTCDSSELDVLLQTIKGGSRAMMALQSGGPFSLDGLSKHLPLKNEPWFDALTWIPLETREYYLNVLRSGGSLTSEPTVTIGTIHSVKGEEADNVMLLTDVVNPSRGSVREDDAEHRVFYVAVTRAKHNLFLVQPQSTTFYSM